MQNDMKSIMKDLKNIFPEMDKLNLDNLLETIEKEEIEYLSSHHKNKIIDYAIKAQHFPTSVINKKNLLPKNKKQEEIATLVFDIRSSTKLLDNTELKEFNSFVNSFIKKAKAILFSETYKGIYDKFTGDGLIVHFSKNVSGKDFIKNALLYAKQIINESDEIFKEILNKLKIDYSDKIGIGVGIDLGKVMWFRNGVELSVIGSSIVYASRLCSSAKKNEILVNNQIYKKVQNKFEFTPREIRPKGFTEKFPVYKLKK